MIHQPSIGGIISVETYYRRAKESVMGFLIAIAVVFVGFAVFVLLTQMAVRNGIRMSGVIDWKTQYELERMEDAGGKQKPLAELYESVAESEDDADEVERKVKEQALKYINSRNSTHVANEWIFLGLGIVLCVVVVLIVASSDSMM